MGHRARSGIALPEVLMVILILGLVAATVIPRVVYSNETKAHECLSNTMLMNARLDACFAKSSGQPPATVDIDRLIAGDGDAFPYGVPKCPYGRPYEFDAATGHIIAHQH
jgi:hypothetical protein